MPRLTYSKRDALRQAVALQALLLADAENPETPPTARAAVARAWRDLEDQKRILRGHGAPRQVPAVNERSKSAQKAPVALCEDAPAGFRVA